MKQPFLIRKKIRLQDFDPAFCDGKAKEEAGGRTAELCQRIGKLQELLYANACRSVLILFQGMDASGKDGAVKKVLEFVNPAGVETANFKTPSAEELAHDFLWRVHKAVPRYGNIGVFNRSHYEDVLVVRVLRLVSQEVWKGRYEQINDFERMLARNGVVLLKFFLHISKAEQAERFQARLDDPRKSWKFSKTDLEMRRRWGEFQKGFQDMINHCSTEHAPWHVVPADRKWYRDFVIAQAVVERLEALEMKWPKPKEDLSRIKIV